MTDPSANRTQTRRTVLQGAAGMLTAFGMPAGIARAATDSGRHVPFPLPLSEPVPFSREGLIAQVRALAAKPYTAPPKVPQAWRDLTYDQYRRIEFKHDSAVWYDGADGMALEFMPPGLYFEEAVEIFVGDGDGAMRQVVFDPRAFRFRSGVPDLPVDETVGFSGIRLLGTHTLGAPRSEFAVFQGASYFRAIGWGQTYGLSARGLALGTASEEGEEFPAFRKFYIEDASDKTTTMRVHAVLDGPSVAGLYTFEIAHPHDFGDSRLRATVMDVRANLFPRRDLSVVGIAPLTSMYLFGPTTPARFDDFRPAVHDSQGLLMDNGAGERLWRPLANPGALQVSSFVDENPRGFGLVQRERDFAAYQDLEANYHDRPSLWVAPRGDWGRGAVTLVEIPADREIFDNIVAFWRPREPLAAGAEHELAYELRWGAQSGPESWRIHPWSSQKDLPVAATRIGARPSFGTQAKPGRLVVIDYGRGRGEVLPDTEGQLGPAESWREWLDSVDVHVSSNGAPVSKGIVQRNRETGSVRLAFHFDPGTRTSVELRAQLMRQGRRISEVWLYRWTP